MRLAQILRRSPLDAEFGRGLLQRDFHCGDGRGGGCYNGVAGASSPPKCPHSGGGSRGARSALIQLGSVFGGI